MTLPEADWRLLRALHDRALDRYCARALRECATVIQDTNTSVHDRYLRLVQVVNERDTSLAAAFNDLRRSTAIQRLASMMALGVVTDEELSHFSQATRGSATTIADLLRSGATRADLPHT